MTSRRMLTAPPTYDIAEFALDSGQHRFLVLHHGAELCQAPTEAEARRVIEAHQFGLQHGLTEGHVALRFRPAA